MLVILALLSGVAPAQTIYYPVQFEFGQTDKYYYGGSDPAVFARAERESQRRRAIRYGSPTAPTRTYSDSLPNQPNAAVFGYTANDAKNDAYQSQPRYFEMSGGKRMLSEPATATNGGTIEIKPYVRPATRTARW